jgi:hypothetical protein
MTLRDLIASLARRWYFIIIGLAITAGLCLVIVRVVPVSYDSQASMVLLPPKSSTGKNGNPFLLLGGLSQAVDILTRTMTSDADSAPLLNAHHGATFIIAADTTTTGPIVLITSTAPTAARAKVMTAAVVREVPVALRAIQARLSVESASQIRVVTVAVDQSGTLNDKSRIQALVGVGAAGVILTVLLTGLIDGILRARKRRVNRRLDEDDDDSGDRVTRTSGSAEVDETKGRSGKPRRANPVTIRHPEPSAGSRQSKSRPNSATATKDSWLESPTTSGV